MDIAKLLEEAESGSVVAQAVLGICYLEGFQVEVDYAQAFRLLSSAADQRASRAIANLGRLYAEGLGIPKDPAKAVSLYERAAKRGEFLAQIELGRIYSRGLGVPADQSAALRWYSAALAGDTQESPDDCEELLEAKSYIASAAGHDDSGPSTG
jgi:TPR repeat protein